MRWTEGRCGLPRAVPVRSDTPWNPGEEHREKVWNHLGVCLNYYNYNYYYLLTITNTTYR